MRGAELDVHPVGGGEGEKAPAQSRDRGGRLEAEAGHHAEQEHRLVQQGDSASQVRHFNVFNHSNHPLASVCFDLNHI